MPIYKVYIEESNGPTEYTHEERVLAPSFSAANAWAEQYVATFYDDAIPAIDDAGLDYYTTSDHSISWRLGCVLENDKVQIHTTDGRMITGTIIVDGETQ